MDWTRQIDSYCERTDFTIWSEPINALTNLAFLIVAVVMFRRSKGTPHARGLACLVFLIGLGSMAFHTTATIWGAVADVGPILGFVLYFLFLMNRDVLDLRLGWNILICLGFVPYSAVLGRLFAEFGLSSSGAYAPIIVLLLLYSGLAQGRARRVAVGLWEGAVFLAFSLLFRWMDGPLCSLIPFGTHWAWHVINAIMLGHMIGVYRAHMLEVREAAR